MKLQKRSLFLLGLLFVAVLMVSAPIAITAQEITDDTGTVLVWTAPAIAPGQHRADATGELSYVDREGNITRIMEVPPQTTNVVGCGETLSQEGNYYMLFMGLDTRLGGDLYLITDAGIPAVFAEDVQFLTCRGGSGTLQYAPDQSYVGYMAYEPGASESATDFSTGELRLANLPGGDNRATFRNAVAFDVAPDGVAFIQFFTNTRNEADEVAISWWDGDNDSEIATITAGEDCRFVSAYVQVGADSQVWTVLGERCPAGLTWQLYRTSADKNNALLVYSQEPRGSMVTYAQVNNLLFSPDGQTLLFTVPDGVEANSASLNAVNIEDLSNPRTLVDRGVVLPRYSTIENATPRVSPDGRWLAVVVKDPGNPIELRIFELTNLETDPYSIRTGDGDTIPWFTFTPDSSAVVYVAGAPNGGDNSISRFNLNEGTDERVERGTFTGWAAFEPAGDEMMLLEWVEVPDGVRPIDFYTDLKLVNIEDGSVSTVAVGGEVVGEEVLNIRFVQPLAWLNR